MNTNAVTKPPQSTAHNWTCPPVLAWLPLNVPGCQVPCRKHMRVCRHWIWRAHLQHPQSEDASLCTNGRYAGGRHQKIECTFSHTHTHMHALRLKRKKGKKGGGSSLQHLSKTFKKATALFCLQQCPRDLTVTMRTPVSLQLTDCTKWV